MNEPDKKIRRWPRGFVPAVVVLALCFSRPLCSLARFALHDDLYSHILLIPFIGLYLVWLKRNALPPASPPDRKIALSLSIAGLVALAGLLDPPRLRGRNWPEWIRWP